MLVPIRCFTCGLPIGDVSAIYRYHKDRLCRSEQKRLGITEKALDIDPRVNIDMEKILDALQIKKLCCRAHLITVMKLVDWY
jgi:DNA-directed RNA polymerase subunit N (RpoN/RPB10)